MIKEFLTRNTVLLKTIRTLLEALAAWGVVVLTNIIAGYELIPPEVQIAVIAVVTALFAAAIAEIGRLLPEPTND